MRRRTRRGILQRLAELLFPPPREGGGLPHGLFPPLLVALTFVSGLVDAVSYLSLGHVFVANMTGNVVFLAFALAGGRGLSSWASLLALAAFTAGARAAGRVHRDCPAERLFVPLVLTQAALVMGALVLSVAVVWRPPVVGLLALGMGMQNGVVHRLAVPDLTTTVVTRTLTGLFADVWGPASVRRLVSVGVLFAGGLVGGLLTVHRRPWWALAVAAAVLLWVATTSRPARP
ncbi:YoaK family protein [Streptomyces sp. NPDC046876]|uniref:YoaK family protein n=1 Tax=Streptomyces sp. NPDC046876 TaxID=3155616 RepID=UPI00340960B3